MRRGVRRRTILIVRAMTGLSAPPRVKRPVRVVALLLAVLFGGALTGCASSGSATTQQAGGSSSVSASPATSVPGISADQGRLYVAVRVREAGRAVGWLPRSPIRLWFEQLNGTRTAIIDAPVNTYNVPTVANGSLLWTGKSSSGTAVGCARGCEADGFVGRITSSPARESSVNGLLTITAGTGVVVFAPTKAPLPERSTCNQTSIDLFPCTRLLTVSGTENDTMVDVLRSSPMTVSIGGVGKRRTITFSDGARTIRAPIQIIDGHGVTTAGTARTTGSCSQRATAWRSSRFVENMLTTTVTYEVHFSSILMTSRSQTLQLEAR